MYVPLSLSLNIYVICLLYVYMLYILYMWSVCMYRYAHKNSFVPDDDFEYLWNNCSQRHPSYLGTLGLQHQGYWGYILVTLSVWVR